MYTAVAAKLAWMATPIQIKGSYEESVLDLYVTNGCKVAGGIPIAPRALMSDGRLELLIVPGGNRVSRYALIALARLGWIRSNLVTKLFGVTATWVQNDVTFEALTPVSAQIDGEPLVEPVRLVRVGVEPKKLGVLLPS
jgi:diacylglycerol kinase family enzyme